MPGGATPMPSAVAEHDARRAALAAALDAARPARRRAGACRGRGGEPVRAPFLPAISCAMSTIAATGDAHHRKLTELREDIELE